MANLMSKGEEPVTLEPQEIIPGSQQKTVEKTEVQQPPTRGEFVLRLVLCG